ncbi:MAG: aminoacyl-tRNA hydrolase [Clostridiaceae bacterium]|nr:aminoacyl-tRNA hydrolase [Clostridiaceae bacterium]
MFIIAGLGNPGKEYERTRHNTGFLCIDYLSALYRIPVSKIKFKSLIGEGIIQGKKVVLAKPQTYMNNSGEAIKAIADYYKVDAGNVVIIYDDVDLEPGVIRIRPKGSSGTHNGMKSIIYHLQTDEFPRFRIGIGKPPENVDMVSYVLGVFSEEEQRIINEVIERTAMAVGDFLAAGIETAMSKYNGRNNNDKNND